MTKLMRLLILLTLIFSISNFTTTNSHAQEADGVAAEEAAPEGGGEEKAKSSGGTSFFQIVFGSGPVGILIWVMLFSTSAAMLAFLIDGFLTVKRDKLIPEDLVSGVRESLNDGDLNSAIAFCEENPSSLSTILMVGFANITEGFEVIQESISASAEMESEKLMQRVNYLNLIGQIAPMLGLLGTVTGMVDAFGTLGTASGQGKQAGLALAISQALWTTCAGLLVSVPALVGFTVIKNNAVRIILESEATVVDLIKTLRNAEIEDDDDEEFYEE